MESHVQTRAIRAVGPEMAAVLPNDSRAWWHIPSMRRLNLRLFSAMLFSSCIGYDNSLFSGLLALTQWTEFMGHPTGAYLGAINAIQSAGVVVAYPVMAFVANKWGRKKSVYMGLFFIALGVGLATGAVNPGMYLVSRFFIGCASGLFGSVPVLVAETAYPTHRGQITAIYHTLYYIGSVLAAWVTFGTRNYSNNWAWRIPSILQVAIPLVASTGFFFCPESPRWLISQERHEEARAFFVEYHADGDASSALVAFQMNEITNNLRHEAAVHKNVSYLDMLRTKGNRHRLLISISIGIFAQWNGVGIVSYYLSIILHSVGVTSVTQQTLINGFLQLWNLIMAVLGALLVDRLGRRFLLLWCSFAMLICYVIITALSGSFAETHHAATGIAVVPMLFLYYAFYDFSYTPLVVAYPAEIWLYELRSRGIAVSQMANFGALFFNAFVNSIALANIAWKYYIVYIGILIIICLTIYLFYPETRGMSLEEISRVFDKAQPESLDTRLAANSDSISAEKEDNPESSHIM